MAHTLTGYDGGCREIHGHSYRLFVTVAGRPENDPGNPKYGMALDFGILKEIVNREIVNRYDHSLVIRMTHENKELIEMLQRHFNNVHVVDYQPTSENLVLLFADRLAHSMPEGVELVSVRLCETATSYAEWFASDNLQ